MTKKRADVLVYEQGLATSREKAKRYIMAGQIYVDQVKVDKAGQMFDSQTKFNLRGEKERYVSRGGYKLEKAIDNFNINLKNLICSDFGASTGGFTDCMLQYGAKKVYSIDVGYGQLDYSLRNNPKVVVIEKTNIRHMDINKIEDTIDFISIDVSFISLELILPKAFELISNHGQIVALIKPQFEAGRNQVAKGGIVKDKEIHREVIEKIYDFVKENNFVFRKLTKSPIKGSHGNVEYLSLIEKEGEFFIRDKISDVVEND